VQYLVIVKLKPDAPRDKIGPLLKPEAQRAWELVQAGVARSLYYLKGGTGAVAILEAADDKEAEAHVASLPMVREGVLSSEILPLFPHAGFERLFAQPGK
jgi:hypothetical protein